MALEQNSQNNKNNLRYDPWESSDMQKLFEAYKQQPNSGAFRELKEEIKTILWLDCFDFLKKSGSAIESFKMTDTLCKWLEEDSYFHDTKNFIGCFFNRKNVIPHPEWQRNHRKYPCLQKPRTKKKYIKLFYRQALKNLRKMQFAIKGYKREDDEKQLRAVRLAFYVIYHMVRIYYVDSMSAKKLSRQEYQRLISVAPSAEGMYVHRTDGMYAHRADGFFTTKEKYSFGRALGWEAAETMLIMHLEKVSRRMRGGHH